ncbi:hypothetical protein ACJX0J_014085 [Zea mays]
MLLQAYSSDKENGSDDEQMDENESFFLKNSILLVRIIFHFYGGVVGHQMKEKTEEKSTIWTFIYVWKRVLVTGKEGTLMVESEWDMQKHSPNNDNKYRIRLDSNLLEKI